MIDPASAARTARESLARGLSVLQAPGVPPAVMQVAEPVAQAMGALHRIESTHGTALGEAAPQALDAIRRGLSMLQAASGQHAAIDQAMEAVAGSLATVHALAQAAAAQPMAATMAAPPQAQPMAPMAAPIPQQVPQGFGSTAVIDPPPAFVAQQAFPPAPAAQPFPAQGFPPPAQQPYPQAQANAFPPQPNAFPPQGAPQAMPQPHLGQPAPQAYPQQAGYGAPPGAAPWVAQQPQAPIQSPGASWPSNPQPQANVPSAPAHPAPHPAPGASIPTVDAPANVPRVEANLGAHSTSNFYKGLSGNDVIESGGIFVATYAIPKLGSNVVIRVSLPGGYEFEALGIVEWTREAPLSQSAGIEAPPGFGAKFTQITQEGRQLVYRYVRNREPLFHDDL